MGRDNQSRVRQANKIARKQGKRAAADRILIISEGRKTEPLYLEDLRKDLRLPTANISIYHSEYGTCPLNIVEYSKYLFLNGSKKYHVFPKAFEKVFVVFDRDEHVKYYQALDKIQEFNKKFKNDQQCLTHFEAFVNIPCFELWLLLHFENISTPIHRKEALTRLKTHIPNYEKGKDGIYHELKDKYDVARGFAETLESTNNPWTEPEPYSGMHNLIDILLNLKR